MFRTFLVAAVVGLGSAAIAKTLLIPQAVSDPLTAVQQLSDSLEKDGAKAFSDGLAKALGNPEATALTKQFSAIEKKKADVSSIVIDRKYGDAIRVIVE